MTDQKAISVLEGIRKRHRTRFVEEALSYFASSRRGKTAMDFLSGDGKKPGITRGKREIPVPATKREPAPPIRPAAEPIKDPTESHLNFTGSFDD